MSDSHGCFDKYKEMLSLIEFTLRDTLYVLGDVIDRGPDGIKILQDMMLRPNVFPLLGNHEFTAAVCLPWLMEEVTDPSLAALDETQIAALSEWIANGGGVTIRSLKELSQEEREDILEYFQEMELFAQIRAGGRDFVLLHSGLGHFSPDKALEDYEKETYSGFLGSFYSSDPNSDMENNPDTVEAYRSKANTALSYTDSEGNTIEDWPVIQDGTDYSTENKYLIFCAADQPYEEIVNHDLADGPSCVVVKESFGNALVPFLANHYRRMIVVDYRYYEGSIAELATETGAQDVIFLNNISMTRNEELVNDLSNLF